MKKQNKEMDYQMVGILITNHNADKIQISSKYDDKFKLWRMEVKLKKKKKK